ncbi:TetR/AcrR family transcriptional regulator [Nocardiopsis sp. NRRL B-16309]|uniref:TetR/AcrR family transcriptional regulator n=1 Tax=Nocardiopsis sp. NRRL B-16309 TaxID=1519494 RepID=UPI0006AE4F06|nr:TetR/AcrR family transcriptional regulator [Nocardiopsis sp. NRRL B-16309]KOX16718.1 TetR family transcriptional regulator [Nocardiopsis sp. NRRL B-16309]
MARTVDHEERRRQVAEALLRTVGRQGLARTTLADIAEEAGVSIGLVQSYFRTKSQLLRFGVDYLYKQAEARLWEVSEGAEPVRSVRDWLVRAAETLLPLDDQRHREITVWLEYLPATKTDPEMARLHKDTTARLLDALTHALDEGVRLGEFRLAPDTRTAAAGLVAFVDGLSIHHLVTGGDAFSRDAIRAALHAYLDRLLLAPESP